MEKTVAGEGYIFKMLAGDTAVNKNRMTQRDHGMLLAMELTTILAVYINKLAAMVLY